MSDHPDSDNILAVLEEIKVLVSDVRNRIDALAEITGRNFDRFEGDLARIEASALQVF